MKIEDLRILLLHKMIPEMFMKPKLRYKNLQSSIFNLQSNLLRNFIVITLLLSLSSCASLFGDKLKLSQVKYEKLSGWSDDDISSAMVAFEQSCKKYAKMPAEKLVHSSNIAGKYGNWQEVCTKKDAYDNPRDFFEANFTPYAVKNWWTSKGLFTGYYESSLKGSREKIYPYIYPVYKTPKDFVKGKQYYSRAQIDSGALENQGLEILWVDDPVQLFFMQIQGSGRAILEDGSEVRLGYDTQNGHKYFPIGKYLLDEKYLEKGKVSKSTIEEWLKNNPDRVQEVLEKNPSYVFFRELKGDGPIGAQGVPLTPSRSLAIDKKFMPYGAPIWLETKVNGGDEQATKFEKLLIAQDTGGAIKGPVRGDIFFGYGQDAERNAGFQNNSGRYFILLPNSVKVQ